MVGDCSRTEHLYIGTYGRFDSIMRQVEPQARKQKTNKKIAWRRPQNSTTAKKLLAIDSNWEKESQFSLKVIHTSELITFQCEGYTFKNIRTAQVDLDQFKLKIYMDTKLGG